MQRSTFARLGTINKYGIVHIGPVFIKYEDGQIIIAAQDPSRKNEEHQVQLQCLRPYRYHRCGVSGVLIYGTAEMDCEDIIPKRIAIFERTRPREEGEEYARKLSDKWKCVIVRITPVRFTSFDNSKF